MAKHEYSFKVQENMAKAVGVDLSISQKNVIEIANKIRGKNVETAKRLLEDAMNHIRSIPVRRYTEGAGHRSGMGPGKFFDNASSQVLALLDSAIANAQSKGLASGKLEIVHINAHRGSNIPRRGRHSRRRMKRAHVEIVLREELTKKGIAKSENKIVREIAQKK